MTAIDNRHEMNIQESLPITFEKVQEESNILWKQIHKSKFFEVCFQAMVGVGTTLGFVAVVLPASVLLTAISFIGLFALGLTSPALLHPTTAKTWTMVKDKIFGVITDMICLPNVTLILPLAFKPNASAKEEKGDKPLVVMVHGFLHNKTCWENLSRKLIKQTRNSPQPITEKDIYAINLGEPLTIEKIDYYARCLATKLEKIRNKRGLDKLDVVLDCHSMGGLVSAHFMTKYASLAGVNVLRLIANGTPWHGTPMAHIGSLTECGKEMLPDDPFHVQLKDRINDKTKGIGEKIYTIASKGDTIVPFHSARGRELDIPESHRFTLNCPTGHIAMQYYPQSHKENIRLILEAIESI